MSSVTLASTRGRLPRKAYLAIVVSLFVMVAWGFWPSYYGPLLKGGVARPWWIHIHAAVFAGWMVLLLAQSWLVTSGRVRLHRRLGQLGILYGVGVLMLGLAVSFATAAANVRSGRLTLAAAAEFLLFPLVDMALFAGFFGAAIAYRRKPDAHKRLIVAATVSLAYAALSRIISVETLLFLPVWLSPLFVAMAFDLATRRSIHPALWASVAILTLAWARIYIMQSPGWLRIGRALLAPFL
jgi:hypothetical protein